MSDAVAGKRILVTGGTGSIGAEIVRQCLDGGAAQVRIFSRDEAKQLALRESLGARSDARYLIGDVRDRDRLRRALDGVDVAFHAAAMKYVAACEYNPFEAVQTNVLGTQHLVQAAVDAGTPAVVLVSTDKAVNPVNTMGATKLVAERILAAANQWVPGSRLLAVRFGNVLGSTGSIVPVVAGRIARGEPVRLSHPSMTRFVMSIRDAVRLVLDSAGQGSGGETFVLKMPAVRIKDLISGLIEILAPRFGRDPASVPIEMTGDFSGEKLDEELLTVEELERTEERDDRFVVHPAWRKNPASRKTVDEGLYHSGKGEFLSPEGIRDLLDRSGALDAYRDR